MGLTKFYHYNIWVEGEDGKRLRIDEVTNDSIFANRYFTIPQKGSKNYRARFQEISASEYHGIIVRTKDESQFVRMNESQKLALLSEVIDDEGETGDIDIDYVNFGFNLKGVTLETLVEVGFQTPGIGVITDYLDEHIDLDEDYDIEYETKFEDKTKEQLERLLDTELKKIEISFKKNPSRFDELETDEAIKTLIPDDYRLKFSASLEPGKKVEESQVEEYLDHFLTLVGMEDSTVEKSITKIDFPKIMNTFRIKGIEGDEEEVEENLADKVMKEKIETNGYGLFDSDLGQELCQRMRQRE